MIDHTETAKKLASDHWHGYVKPTIEAHTPLKQAYTHSEVMAIAEHHYLTAAFHFFGHAIEMERRGDFRPRIGDPLTPEEIADIAAITPSGCQNKECKHWDLPAPCNCTLHGMEAATCKLYAEPGEREESDQC